MNILQEIKDEIASVRIEPSSKDLNILALIFLVIPGLIGAYTLFWKGSSSGYVWIGAGAVLCLARVIPSLFRGIYHFWVGLSVIMGFFVSRILLTIIFFLVIMPLGLIMRVTGRDPMDRKWDPDAASYWIKREQESDTSMERYGKQF
jgi:hypothetical protein